MKKQYIKNPIPEQISEEGGANILFVNKQTVPLDGAIQEALAGNYCTGQATLIRNFFFGLMRSMADGVRRDGHARQIANFLTVYPVFKGEVDLDRGFDPAVNRVMIRARLLNEMDLDITDWSFEDVTPGKRAFTLQSVKAGAVIGEYVVGETGHLNGKNLPSTEAAEELRVHWAVEGTDTSGDIPAAKLASDVSRADIASDALAELASAEYDGKTIVFTVRGNFSSAKIAARLRYAPPPTPPTATIDEIGATNDGETIVMDNRWNSGMDIVALGENLFFEPAKGDKVELKFTQEGEETTYEAEEDEITPDASHAKLVIDKQAFANAGIEDGNNLTVVVTTHAGVAGSEPQTLTRQLTYSE